MGQVENRRVGANKLSSLDLNESGAGGNFALWSDNRVRNTIHLARKASRSQKRNCTTRLHRWFDSQRPVLFDGLSYAPFSTPWA